MKLLSSDEVLKIVPYSSAQIYRMERQGTFPKRLKLGTGRGGRVAWLESEIRSWVEAAARSRISEKPCNDTNGSLPKKSVKKNLRS